MFRPSLRLLGSDVPIGVSILVFIILFEALVIFNVKQTVYTFTKFNYFFYSRRIQSFLNHIGNDHPYLAGTPLIAHINNGNVYVVDLRVLEVSVYVCSEPIISIWNEFLIYDRQIKDKKSKKKN